ncbi:L,D-transpeptidase family protein [Parvibaculum sp.]|uniref:L,D-transpeptidase family protein n=1 Tax=Parvibaculum sp. TaxID=2024848 RepID=UPI000C93DB68|nr:L,D-transpeptidase family protein [Parvibaculum sp.]MAB15071.1 hypothetical protein [Parvibaculum sp.]
MRRAVFPLLAILAFGAAIFLYANWPAGNPLPPATRADRILIDKSEHSLSLFSGGRSLRVYRISLGTGGIAPKTREGDRLTPDGRYKIASRNPDSAYHLSLRISYPDASDVARANAAGISPGSDIMIHGLRNGLGWFGRLHRLVDWTAGCIAVTNPEIEEIWRVVPDGTPVEIRQ